MTDATLRPNRSSYLSVTEYTRLELVMNGVGLALGRTPYLVGSVLTRPDYRDVDIRVVATAPVLNQMFESKAHKRLIEAAMSSWLSEATGLPIDFQWQSEEEFEAEGAKLDKGKMAGRPRPLGGMLRIQSEEFAV